MKVMNRIKVSNTITASHKKLPRILSVTYLKRMEGQIVIDQQAFSARCSHQLITPTFPLR